MTAFHFLVSGMPWWRHALVDFLFAVAMIWIAVTMWEMRAKRRAQRVPAKSQIGIEEVNERLRISNGEIFAQSEMIRSKDKLLEGLMNQIDTCEDLRQEALRKLESAGSQLGTFTPLQMDALRLSMNMLKFVKELGTPPPSKYSPDDIRSMPLSMSRKLLQDEDGDYIESAGLVEMEDGQITSAVYIASIVAKQTRLYKWFQKVEGKYNVALYDQVAKMRDRLAGEGFAEEPKTFALTGCFDPEKRIKEMAAKFWELAYKVGEHENT